MLLAAGSGFLFAAGAGEKAQGADDSLKYIQDKGVLVLGLDDSFPPMGFRGENGEITGFDIDLAKEVCNRLGVELELRPIDWDAKILDLNSRDIDVIWNGLSITEDRKKTIGFSTPYLANRQIVIVLEGSGIDSKKDLAGKKVGVQMGSSGDAALTADKDSLDSIEEVVKYQDYVQSLMDLEAGRIDAIVVDEILGRYYIGKKPGVFAVASGDFGSEEYGIGFRKGDAAFIEAVNQALADMLEDGSAGVVSKKWFGEDVFLK